MEAKAEERKLKKGIGWDGKTLMEMVEERERLTKETGRYHGLKDLELNDSDPLRLETLHTRLRAAMVAGREQARMISASPLAREVAELACGLFTPEGDCILQSTGIIIHIPLMGQTVEWMIRHGYENDVGINEGDIFTSNDNMIAGMHPPDVYDLIPIFHEGELLGWAITVIMEAELGAIAPGSMPSAATERFADGLRWTAEKTGTNDRWSKTAELRIKFNCRLGDLVLLDRKAALGANIKVREEVKGAIKEFGVDYYKKGVRELIEIERRSQIERVKRRTVPGRLRTQCTFENFYSDAPVPPHHAVDQITLVPFDFHIKPDGRYFWDFDGAGPWGWHPNNTTPSALTGAACLFLTQTIAYTGHANYGTFVDMEMNTPYDTYVNPSSPFISTQDLFSVPIQGGGLAVALQSRVFFSRGFVEEVMAGSPATNVFGMAGIDHYGNDYGLLMAETAGTCASGACSLRDGLSPGHVMWLPTVDMGNVEVWELLCPTLSLGRRLLPNAYGWGKFCSGLPMVNTFMVYKSPMLSFDSTPMSTVNKIHPSTGMYGGYPSGGSFYKLLTNSNTLDLIEQRRPLVHGIDYPKRDDMENVSGDLLLETRRSTYLKAVARHGDIFQLSYGGHTGGFGDPIERGPALVKKDLDNGLVTADVCRNIHCIEASRDEKTGKWVIDEKKTEELREDRRKERLSKGIPVKDWWKKRREEVAEGRMPGLLRKMYNGSLEKGDRWPGEFRAFWNLPEDFHF